MTANWDKLGLENLRYLLVVLVCGIWMCVGRDESSDCSCFSVRYSDVPAWFTYLIAHVFVASCHVSLRKIHVQKGVSCISSQFLDFNMLRNHINMQILLWLWVYRPYAWNSSSVGKESRTLECNTPEQCGAVARQQHWGYTDRWCVSSSIRRVCVGEAVCLVIFVVGVKN